ncbi:hypothetical protein N9N67_05410 [Bacteriovoracaceae bacterium]|nr:hypothetical protein [Bacteriovoracaceae bacterium]
MNSQIYSYISYKDKFYAIQVYGYSSRSLPGLEIIGPHGQIKNLKNKIIYFCRKNNLKIPPRRYVIGYEDFNLGKKLAIAENKSLELPTLLLFLNLCGILGLAKIENCFNAGTFSIDGKLISDQQYLNKMLEFIRDEDLIYVGDTSSCTGKNISLKKLSVSLLFR